jgi:hypothetical protein
MVHFYHNGNGMEVPVDKLKEASAEMLEDVGMTAVEIYRANNPDSSVGNA